ncbi:MAG: PRC-barrel domain-containing protein [Candidatus Woesearchaeota archaeon]
MEITSDDILGKEAIDPAGAIVGTITKLHIDSKNKEITGITLDMGLFQPDLFIGLAYIETIGMEAVFLNITPFDKLIGRKVVTETGKTLGTVKGVTYEKKKLISIVVSTGLFRKQTIDSDQIAQIDSVILLKS